MHGPRPLPPPPPRTPALRTTVKATPLRPMTGPVVKQQTVGPYGATATRTATHATPLNPYVGPVTTTTGTAVYRG